MIRKTISYLSAVVAMLFAGSAEAQYYEIVTISSGFNADVIAEGVGSSSASTSHDVDGVSFAFVSKDFQLTSSSAPLTYGLPANGLFTSAFTSTPGLPFQLGSYNGNNVLRMPAVGDTGTMVFSTPVAATTLYMIATTGSGTSTVSATINFTDGTSQSVASISLSDWYGATNFAINGIGRINRTTDALENGGGTNPRIYQTAIAIDAANQSKLIQNVVLTLLTRSGTSTTANIFGFSVSKYTDCLSPTAVTASNITSATADISWSAPTSVPSGGYDLYYTNSATAVPTSATTPNLTALTGTTASVSGLTQNTVYYVWMRSVCNGVPGPWAYCMNFRSACGVFSVPYFENFDTTSTGSSANNNAPPCWSYLETSGMAAYGYVGTTSPFSSPNAYFLYNGTSSSTTGGNSMLIGPETMALMDGAKRVRFYARASTSGTTLDVGTVSSTTDASTFTAIQTITLTTTQTQYVVYVPSGSNSNLAFRHGLTGNYRSISIDNIWVEPNPSCIEPSGINFSGTSVNGTTANWTAPYGTAPANGYTVYYSTANGAPNASTVLDATNSVSSTTTSATLSGLNSGTTYYVWIRSNCSSTEFSTWTGPVSVTTASLCPTLLSPSNSALNVSPTPSIYWSAVNGATGYLLTVGTTSGGNDILNAVDVGNVTNYSFASPLTLGQQYYYTVVGYAGGTVGSSCTQRNFTVIANAPTAANDECANATVLTPGANFAQNPLTGTVSGASTSGPVPSCQTTSYYNVWYSVVVPASGSITLETHSVSGSSLTDTVLAVYSGTCGSLTQVGCDDDSSADGNFSLLTLTGQTPGATLLIEVSDYSSSNVGEFQVSAYDASLATNDVTVKANDIKLYPNPFTDVINISNVRDVKSLTIVDLSGRLIKNIELGI